MLNDYRCCLLLTVITFLTHCFLGVQGVLVVADVLCRGSLTHDSWAVISEVWWWPMSCVVVVSPMTRGLILWGLSGG